MPSCGFLGGRRCLQDRLRSGRLRGLVAVEPAAFVVFDLLARNGKDLRDRPYGKRRRKLEELLGASRLPDGLVLTPATTDPTVARGWMLAHRCRVWRTRVAKRVDQLLPSTDFADDHLVHRATGDAGGGAVVIVTA